MTPASGASASSVSRAYNAQIPRNRAGFFRCSSTSIATGPLAGVIYVTDRDDVTDPLRRAASAVGLEEPAFSLRALADVIAQARAAAGAGRVAANGAGR